MGDGEDAAGAGADAGPTSATASADGGAAVGVDAGSTSATASADMATVEGFDVTDEAGESAEMAVVSRLEAEAEAGAGCGHGLTEEDLLDYEGGGD